MKKQFLKKLTAFTIAIMMFSSLPQVANAQKNNPCPPGYKLICYRDPWTGQRVCNCYHNGNGKIIGDNTTSQQSIVNLELEYPPIASIKIYDATGKLIKTLVNGRISQREHQIEWNRKDEQGNTVSAGIYILQVVTNGKSDTKKFSIL